ncbi:hypothetical protein ACSMXM_10490 [Pacificimonas sp. ICDLI1SI03]
MARRTRSVLRHCDGDRAERLRAVRDMAMLRLETRLIERCTDGDLQPYKHGGEVKGEYRTYPDNVAIELLRQSERRQIAREQAEREREEKAAADEAEASSRAARNPAFDPDDRSLAALRAYEAEAVISRSMLAKAIMTEEEIVRLTGGTGVSGVAGGEAGPAGDVDIADDMDRPAEGVAGRGEVSRGSAAAGGQGQADLS